MIQTNNTLQEFGNGTGWQGPYVRTHAVERQSCVVFGWPSTSAMTLMFHTDSTGGLPLWGVETLAVKTVGAERRTPALCTSAFTHVVNVCLCFLHVQCVGRVEQQPARSIQLCGWLFDRLIICR